MTWKEKKTQKKQSLSTFFVWLTYNVYNVSKALQQGCFNLVAFSNQTLIMSLHVNWSWTTANKTYFYYPNVTDSIKSNLMTISTTLNRDFFCNFGRTISFFFYFTAFVVSLDHQLEQRQIGSVRNVEVDMYSEFTFG